MKRCKAREELINNTVRKVFECGRGGDEVGYKKLLRNRNYETIDIEFAEKNNLYASCLFLLDDCLSKVKRFGNKVIGSETKRKLKRMLRQYEN